MEINFFCQSFRDSEIRIQIPNPDPDPQTQLNPDPIQICTRYIDQDLSVQPGVSSSDPEFCCVGCSLENAVS